MSWKKGLWIAGVVAAAGVAVAVPATASQSAPVGTVAPAGDVAVMGEWKHVKSTVADVHVYKHSTGDDIWGHLKSCQSFFAEGAENGRYRTTVVSPGGQSVTGWIPTNPDWIASGRC
jgi:hypothetical protein